MHDYGVYFVYQYQQVLFEKMQKDITIQGIWGKTF